jgi:hypothetical protein
MRLGWAVHKATSDSPTRSVVQFRVVLRIASTILAVIGAILLISGLAIQITRNAR